MCPVTVLFRTDLQRTGVKKLTVVLWYIPLRVWLPSLSLSLAKPLRVLHTWWKRWSVLNLKLAQLWMDPLSWWDLTFSFFYYEHEKMLVLKLERKWKLGLTKSMPLNSPRKMYFMRKNLHDFVDFFFPSSMQQLLFLHLFVRWMSWKWWL